MEEQGTYFEDDNGKIEKIVSVRVDYLSKLADKKYDLASETIVKFIRNRNWIYTTKDDNKPEIYIYKDGIYVPEGKSEIEEQLRKELGPNFNHWIVKQVLDKIRADTYIEPQEFFKEGDPFEIPVLNGAKNTILRNNPIIFIENLAYDYPNLFNINAINIINENVGI
jgi:hypothetical protein